MADDNPGQGTLTRAREFGAERYPPPLRQLVILLGLVRKVGLRTTLKHAVSVIERRAHHVLVDRRLYARLKETDAGEIPLQGLSLRTATNFEAAGSFNSGATPSKTFHWALAATGIEPSKFHFVDVGSGWGSLLLPASAYPFRGITCVEFAKELHDKASANLAWARSQGHIARSDIDLCNESALETRLPDGPLLLFLFCPFREVVMRAFLDRVDEAVRTQPRPVVAIYVNPSEAHAFERPGVTEIPLRGSKALLLKLFSPYRVRAYSWNALPESSARSGGS